MQATLIGFSAILMWSLLALLTASSGEVPPFQLATMCFSIATAIGLIALAAKPSGFRNLHQPLRVWCLGVGGLFGYHFLYFNALRNAPAVEASLIGYLWPLLIVVGSAFLPGERLGWQHITGVLAGLAGTVLIVSKNSFSFNDSFAFGYGAALLSTLILIASGVVRANWRIALACILITGGAVVAAKDLLFARARREGQAEE